MKVSLGTSAGRIRDGLPGVEPRRMEGFSTSDKWERQSGDGGGCWEREPRGRDQRGSFRIGECRGGKE